MSLADLTRNCFQNGISASKWASLCQLYLEQNSAVDSDDLQTALSNSVLVLYRSYPGDNDLQEYLKVGMQNKMISASAFVGTFLQAARSPKLHTPATLDMLCRVALDAHYSPGLPSIEPILSFSDVQDALFLLRTAYTLPGSHFHQLTTSASELFVLILAAAGDTPQSHTPTQAMINFADANDLLQNFRLPPGVRQLLETLVISLSVVIGDDGQAREAQMMHTVQLALGKSDSSSDNDLVTFGLVLKDVLANRAAEFGPASASFVALLIAILRWTACAPVAFYTQLITASFSCLIQSSSGSVACLWRAFIVGRLPTILVMFEQAVKSDATMEVDWREALQTAVLNILRQTELVTQCDNVLRTSIDPGEDESSRSFQRDFLQVLSVELLDSSVAISLDPTIFNSARPRLQFEAQDAGVDLETYFDARLSIDGNIDEPTLVRIWKDPSCHLSFAQAFYKKFVVLAMALDVESFSHLCRIMYSFDTVGDILSLHVKLTDLIFHALAFLDGYDCEAVGDPQSAVGQLGDVVLFVQFLLGRYKARLEQIEFTMEKRTLSSDYLRSAGVVHPLGALAGEDAAAFNAWFKALFDSSSEGIDDTILRATSPKRLLRISATLFSRAIQVTTDKSVLDNGVSYFLGPLLNWTLNGVITALISEVERKGFSAPTMTILQNLILSPSCPRPVILLCSPRIKLILKKFRNMRGLDIPQLTAAVSRATGAKHPGQDAPAAGYWQDQPTQVIREAFTAKIPSINIERCSRIMGSLHFVQMFWTEICTAAGAGHIESCKRISTFVLTMPLSSHDTPPLLPIFVLIFLPSQLPVLDLQETHTQTAQIKLLANVVSSALVFALHLEWALGFASPEKRHLSSHSVSVITKRLAAELLVRKSSPSAVMLGQQLRMSPSFMANFPTALLEI